MYKKDTTIHHAREERSHCSSSSHQQLQQPTHYEEHATIQERVQQSLRGAVYVGDVEEIQRCLALLCDPVAIDRTQERRRIVTTSPPDEYDQTLLHVAALFGRVETVRLLLEHGADVNALTKGRRTPLMYAACRGHGAVVEILLADHAINSVDAKDAHGTTAVEWAATNGYPKIAEMLAAHSILPYPKHLQEFAKKTASARQQYNKGQACMFSQQISHELTHDELEHAHFHEMSNGIAAAPKGPPPLRGFWPAGASHDDCANSLCK